MKRMIAITTCLAGLGAADPSTRPATEPAVMPATQLSEEETIKLAKDVYPALTRRLKELQQMVKELEAEVELLRSENLGLRAAIQAREGVMGTGLQKFGMLKSNMSKRQVGEILGADGVLISTAGRVETYQWEIDGGIINVTFDSGMLWTTSQQGLGRE